MTGRLTALRERRRRGERGAAVVEFAFVFPFIILPILLAILQYGYRYWALETAAATAREAARQLAVGTDPICVERQTKSMASGPAMGLVGVTRTPTAPRVGQLVTVTVEFQSLDMKILPVPDDGRVAQSAEARVQKVRAGTTTDPYLPC